MAYTSGFFDAVDQGNGVYDREYSAATFAHYFSLLVKNGVFADPSTGMQVKASTSPNMTVSVQPGNGWINGYYVTVSDNSPEVLIIPTANPSLARIDSIIMGLNYVDRKIQLYVKSGAVSASPSAVALQRDTSLYELELAQVTVGAGVTSIAQANITDMRANSSRCGIVAGTIDEIDTTDLFAQYDNAFQTWFTETKASLEGDVAANLLSRIVALEDSRLKTEDKATKAMVEAGTDDSKYVTPAAVSGKLNISAKATAEEVKAGTVDDKYLTPKSVKGSLSQYKVGDIQITARTGLGDSWLLCNGEEFNPTTYPLLSALLTKTTPSSWEYNLIPKNPTYGVLYSPKVTYGNGVWILAGHTSSNYYPIVYRSKDPMGSWDQSIVTGSDRMKPSIFYYNGLWVFSCYYRSTEIPDFFVSFDNCVSWLNTGVSDTNNRLNDDLHCYNGLWLVTGEGYDSNDRYQPMYYYSTQPDISGSWTRKFFPEDVLNGSTLLSTWVSCAYCNEGTWVVAGYTRSTNYPIVYVSTNPIASGSASTVWTSKIVDNSAALYNIKIYCHEGTWVIVGLSASTGGYPIIYTTTNPLGTWTRKQIDSTNTLKPPSIAYGNGVWSIVGGDANSYPILYTATDLAGTWTRTQVDRARSASPSSITYKKGRWVISATQYSDSNYTTNVYVQKAGSLLPDIPVDNASAYIKAKEET